MLSIALLTGNGVTAQLISAFKDSNMMGKFKENNLTVYNHLNELFRPFRYQHLTIRQLYTDTGYGKINIDDVDYNKGVVDYIIERLSKQFPNSYNDIFTKYFLNYSLINQVFTKELIGIETLLKVARMFDLSDYDRIKSEANRIYYNDGHINISDVNNLNVDKFKSFINQFNYIFTTNFDRTLDDVADKEVFHIHGGFDYKLKIEKEGISTLRDNHILPPDESYLIWGIDENDKEHQANIGGTFLPLILGYSFLRGSILSTYLSSLKSLDYDEIHIWGYSGLNDGHINKNIASNYHVRKIFIYCDPDNELYNKVYENRMKQSYKVNHNVEFVFRSWNYIWDKFR